jgi:hypothetical protein
MATFATNVFAAGNYAGTWNSVAMGLFAGEGQSPVIEIIPRAQVINNASKYGRTPIAAIGQGAEAFFSAILMEMAAGAIGALWPWDGTQFGRIPAVGVDWYEGASALVLTAQTGTRAATAGPSTITAPKSYPMEDQPARYQLGNIHREIPLRLRLFPDSTITDPIAGSSGMKFWTIT